MIEITCQKNEAKLTHFEELHSISLAHCHSNYSYGCSKVTLTVEC